MTAINVAMAAFVTAWGLFMLLFGYRYYRLVAMLEGIGVGAAAGALAALFIVPQHPMLMYTIALAGIAVFVPCAYYISVFIIGLGTVGATVAGLSFMLINAAGIEMSSTTLWTFGIICAVAGLAGGILAVYYNRQVIIIVTSLGGALMGVAAAISAAMTAQSADQLPDPTWWQIAMALAAAVALAVIGIIIQIKTTAPAAATPAARSSRSPVPTARVAE